MSRGSRSSKVSNVLVVGSGGREHAIAWKILQSRLLGKLYIAQGNGGTEEFNIPNRADDLKGLAEFAKTHDCFTVVGPEAPLAAGIVDLFAKEGLPIFGPTMSEARLETSKAFAKEFMSTHGIPTTEFRVFSESQQAIDYACRLDGKVAIKADGLASGKGVFVCSSTEESEHAIRLILERNAFGESGKKIVVEKKIEGKECSLMTICDGTRAFPFGTARDHKRAIDGDRGPNTGGMGAFSPASNLLDSVSARVVIDEIANPVVKASGFHGFLYLGLMLTKQGPQVLEFNARLGDPEAQAILPRLQSDLLEVLLCVQCEESVGVELKWNNLRSTAVIMCSEGYPQNPVTGDAISGIDNAATLENVLVFHSGTIRKGGKLLTNGGRVLGVTGLGKTMPEASRRAYEGVSKISWRGEHHRSDIGVSNGA
ncbi:MAG: phosphoribosylamine--glycine ligase [Nitrososphaerales archaeon]